MDFWQAVTSSIRHIHPLLTDFPAAFLPLSVVLNLVSGRWPKMRQVAWVTMIVGTIGALLAYLSGDATAESLSSQLRTLVQPHQLMATLTTIFFLGLTIWQWRAMRNHKDVMGTVPFIVLSIIGFILLLITGMYGGSLVFDHGVGVSTPS
jgi:uncharacterized membrane protein